VSRLAEPVRHRRPGGGGLRAAARAARLVVLLLVLLVALGVSAQAQDAGPRVVVIGVAGLRWQDVGPATPAITALVARGATGVLSVKALPAVSCPADGWLTLGAGARAQAFSTPREPCGSDLAVGVTDGARNAASRDGARLFALADALGAPADAVGPGAQLAVGGPGVSGSDPGAAVRVLDAGTVGGPDRAASLQAADAAVGAALAAVPPGADVLLVGLSEGPGEATAHLHVAAAAGPSFPPGALRSASTRRTPYVQLVDVAPTVLRLTGQAVPDVMDGQAWTATGSAPTPAALRDLDRQAVEGKRASVPFFVVLIAAQVLLVAVLRRRPRALRLVLLAGTAAPGASYLAHLVPWWRAPAPLLALVALVLVLSTAGALAVRRTRHPVGLLCAATAGLLVLDLVTGARLQMGSPAGYSALVAGRFAGIGNVAFGVYATAALLATASLAAGRRAAGLAVAAVALVVVAADGAPPWGSDVGGVLALVPAFVVLGLLLTGARVSVARIGAAALGAAVVVAALAVADAARPVDQRTHLGRFAGQVRDGTAGELLQRKAEAVLGLLFHSPVTAALPLAVAAVVALVLRPPPVLGEALDRTPGLRPALAALAVVCTLGFVLNDSGAAVPALALLVLVPAVGAVVARRAGPESGGP